MNRKILLTVLGIALSFGIAIGGWALTATLIANHEQAIFAKHGILKITENTQQFISAEEAVAFAMEPAIKTVTQAGNDTKEFLDTFQHTEVLENGKWRVTFLSEALPDGMFQVAVDAVTGDVVGFYDNESGFFYDTTEK